MYHMYPDRDSLYSERGVGGLGHYDYANSVPVRGQSATEGTPQKQPDVQHLLNEHFNRAGDVQLIEETGGHHAG